MRLIDRMLLRLLGESGFRLRLTRRFEKDLQAFLQSGQQIKFKTVAKPDVSVIIPVFNSAHHTYRCLRSLAADTSVSMEVIVYDNASNDATAELLQRCKNITVVENAENIGFVGAVNAASRHAHGRFVLLLNNDTTILSGSLRDATGVFDTEPNVGAVGVRIKLASGHLQEAGCIIFQEGTTNGYLRGRKTNDPGGMYMRDVDFCSGVFLLMERSQFRSMGGLDEVFAPAYYEDTDLCMRLRAKGLRIVYTPSILVEHFEFGSQPSAAAFSAISEQRPLFMQRWQAALNSEGYHERKVSNEIASRRLVPRPRLLLVLDQGLPEDIPVSIRMAIQSAIGNRWTVSLFIMGLRHVSWPEFHALYGNKIELIFNRRSSGLLKLLRARKNYFDLVAALGAQSSAALEKLRKSAPDCLAGAESFMGMKASELEQIVEKLSARKTTQG
jgi:GT2 family glycosyltransferase